MQRPAASERPRRRRRTCRQLAPSTSATQPVRALLAPATTNRKPRRRLAGHPLHSVVPCRGPRPRASPPPPNSSAVSTSLPPPRFPRRDWQSTAAGSVEGGKNLPTTWVGNGRAGRCVRACVRVGLTYGLGLQGLEATQTAAAAADGPVTRGPCSPTLPNQDTEKSERARAGGRPYRPARTRVQESNAGSALQCSCNA